MQGEEFLDQLGVGNLRGIESDLHRLGMAGGAAADLLVGRALALAAGIADFRFGYARQRREFRLRPPETSRGEDGFFHGFSCLSPPKAFYPF